MDSLAVDLLTFCTRVFTVYLIGWLVCGSRFLPSSMLVSEYECMTFDEIDSYRSTVLLEKRFIVV